MDENFFAPVARNFDVGFDGVECGVIAVWRGDDSASRELKLFDELVCFWGKGNARENDNVLV